MSQTGADIGSLYVCDAGNPADGRISPDTLDGVVVEMYHYSATAEFPYFIGCYRGVPVTR